MPDRVEVEVLATTDKATKSLGKYVGALALATAGALALKKLTYDNVKAGLKYAGSIDELSASFRVLLRDGAAAEVLMGEIQDFAATTPFQMEQLANATRVLINTGTDVDQVTKTLEMLGNAAMGNEETMGRLTDAYSKLQVKGRASLEELNRFLEAGVPILDELQKSLGVTKEELFKMISAGKVQFSQVNEALENLTTGEGRLAGLIAVQSKTLPGLMSTLRDVIDQMRGGFMEAFLPALKHGLENVITWLSDVAKNVAAWAKKNQAVIFAIFTNLPEIMKEVFNTVLEIIRQAFTGNTIINIMKVFGQYVTDSLRLGISTIPFLFKTVLAIAEDAWAAFGDNAGKYIINGIVNAILTGPRWASRFIGWLTGNEDLVIGKVDLFGIDSLRDVEEFKDLLTETFEGAGREARTMVGSQMTNWATAVKEVAGLFDGPVSAGAAKVAEIIERGKGEFSEWQAAVMSTGKEIVVVEEAVREWATVQDDLTMSGLFGLEQMSTGYEALAEWIYYTTQQAEELKKVQFEMIDAVSKDLFGFAKDYMEILTNLGVAEEKLFHYKKLIGVAEATIGMFVALAKAATVWEKIAAVASGLLAIGKILSVQAPPRPSLAAGGIATGPMAATIGDAGPMRTGAELVAPLDRIGGNTTIVIAPQGHIVTEDNLKGFIAGTVREMQRGY